MNNANADKLIDSDHTADRCICCGEYPDAQAIDCTINAADFEAASAGDGKKLIKVFVRNAAGTWSVA